MSKRPHAFIQIGDAGLVALVIAWIAALLRMWGRR